MIRLLRGDMRETLAALEPGSCQVAITSPPYYSLRSYGTPDLTWADGWVGSLGLEPDPECFVRHIVECFQAVKRVLRDDGTCWVNMGDSYAASGRGGGGGSFQDADVGTKISSANHRRVPVAGYKQKDLLEIPSMVAQALRADGWYLRSRIPWLKRNAMPESVTDRPASSVEYVFLLSKSVRYFWDADAVRVASGREASGNKERKIATLGERARLNTHMGASVPWENDGTGRNRRNGDWFFESWQGLLLDEDAAPLALVVNPAPLKIAHYASFPPKLVEPMVKASTSEKGCCPECGAPWVRMTEKSANGKVHAAGNPAGWGMEYSQETTRGLGTVNRGDWQSGVSYTTTGWRASCIHTGEPVPQTILDPFAGAGTTLMVADRLGRNAIGCELSESYSDMGTDRIVGDSPMFVEMESA